MDLDALIAQITDEVCSRIENEGAANAGSSNVAGAMEYTLMDPSAKIDDIARVCSTAKQKKFASVCVAQWFVAYAKEQLSGSDVKVCTSVGLPGGISATAAKGCAARSRTSMGR